MRKSMYQIVTAALTLFVLGGALAGCSGTGQESGGEGAADSGTEISSGVINPETPAEGIALKDDIVIGGGKIVK